MTPPTQDRPLTVLVVDAEPDTAASLAALLELYGYAVRTASDGPSAVAAASADRPDVVITELRLPGMCGWELARELRVRFHDRTPFIVAVTGAGQPKDRERSADAGIDLHLVKPADPAVIAAALGRLRAGRGSERSAQPEPAGGTAWRIAGQASWVI